jgi:protein-S-isoprenylcysteine O-methyltransferase Ste14
MLDRVFRRTAVEGKASSDWLGFSLYLGLACWVLFGHKGTLIWVPFFALDLFFARSFLTRKPLQAQASGWQPRLAGYLGTLWPFIFFQLSACYFPKWIQLNPVAVWQATGLMLSLAGLTLEIWTALHLRDSFSIVPQARALVTSGPFRYVRHPLYVGYLLLYSGVWFAAVATVPLTSMLVGYCCVMYWRAQLEERVLRETFSEYREYQQQAGCFLPRFSKPRVVNRDAVPGTIVPGNAAGVMSKAQRV